MDTHVMSTETLPPASPTHQAGSPMDASRLDQLVAKVLREELGEDENTREQSLEQFRDWILKNPDIRDCPTDDNFLLPFLRVRKYSVPMAEQTLIRLLKFQHNFPLLHFNLDFEDPDIDDVISCGYCFTSPFRDQNGQSVMLLIPRHLDLSRHNYKNPARAYVMNFYALARDEATQVLGINFICDYSHVSPAFLTLFPLAVVKGMAEHQVKAIPLRFKKMHVLNLPPVANWLIKVAFSVLDKKYQDRIFFHSSLEELHQHVDPSVLPKEYGGTMPMEEMIGLWKKQLAVSRESILAQNRIKLVGDSFKNDLGSTEAGISDVPGSFRKLAVD